MHERGDGRDQEMKNSRKFDPQPEWLITQLTPNCPYADVVAYEIFYLESEAT